MAHPTTPEAPPEPRTEGTPPVEHHRRAPARTDKPHLGRRFLRTAGAAAALVAAVATGDRGGPAQDTGIQHTGSDEPAGMTRVDTSVASSPLDLDKGVFSIGTHSEQPTVEAQVEKAVTIVDSEPQIEQEIVGDNGTVSKVAKSVITDATGDEHPSQSDILAVTTEIGAMTPDVEDLDEVNPDTVLNTPDRATIDRLVDANNGTDADPALNQAAATLKEAIKTDGYNQARDEAAVVLEAAGVDMSALPETEVEPLGPTIPDDELETYFSDAEATGGIVRTELPQDRTSIWDVQKTDYNLSNPATNVADHLAEALTTIHTDPTISENFDAHTMEPNQTYVEVNPKLLPLISAISALNPEQLFEIKTNPNVSPAQYQALITILHLNERPDNANKATIFEGDKAAAHVVLRALVEVDANGLGWAINDTLGDKTPEEGAALLAENPELITQLLPDTAFPTHNEGGDGQIDQGGDQDNPDQGGDEGGTGNETDKPTPPPPPAPEDQSDTNQEQSPLDRSDNAYRNLAGTALGVVGSVAGLGLVGLGLLHRRNRGRVNSEQVPRTRAATHELSDEDVLSRRDFLQSHALTSGQMRNDTRIRSGLPSNTYETRFIEDIERILEQTRLSTTQRQDLIARANERARDIVVGDDQALVFELRRMRPQFGLGRAYWDIVPVLKEDPPRTTTSRSSTP